MSIGDKIQRIIRWCFVSKTTADTGDFPVQQISYMAKVTESPAWYPYGYHAVAKEDALGLMLTHQGGTHVHLPGSPRERILIADGEVIVYHPDTKSRVHFRTNGDIDVLTVGSDINITSAANVNVVAAQDINITAAGETKITSTGDVTIDVAGDIKTLSDSTKFANAADTEDLHTVLSDLIAILISFGFISQVGFNPAATAIKVRLDALR